MPDKLREFIYLDDVSVNSHIKTLLKERANETTSTNE